jgi:hypothetical protein
LINLELSEDRLEEVRTLFRAAIHEMPLNADIRRRYMEFETKQGDPQRAKEVLLEASASGLVL